MLGGTCSPCCGSDECCAQLEGYGWSVTPSSNAYGLCNQAQLNSITFGYTNKPPSDGDALKTQNFFYFYWRWSDQQTLLVSPQRFTRFGIAEISYGDEALRLRITTCAGTAVYALAGQESILGKCPGSIIDFTPESLVSFTPSGNCTVTATGGFKFSRYSSVKSAASNLSSATQIHIKVTNSKISVLDGQPLTDLYSAASTPEAVAYKSSDITLIRGTPGTACAFILSASSLCPVAINNSNAVISSTPCPTGPAYQQQPAFFYCQQNNSAEFNSGYAVGGTFGSEYEFAEYNRRYVMLFPPTSDCGGFGTGAWKIQFRLPVAQINVYWSKINASYQDASIPVFADGHAYFQAGDLSAALLDETKSAFSLEYPIKIYETGDWSGDGPDELVRYYTRDLFANASFNSSEMRSTRKRIPDTDFDAWGGQSRLPLARIRTTITLEGIA